MDLNEVKTKWLTIYLEDKDLAARKKEVARLLTEGGWSCTYCLRPANTFDHVLPRARGGADSSENLVPACVTCNKDKYTMSPEEWKELLNTRIDGVATRVNYSEEEFKEHQVTVAERVYKYILTNPGVKHSTLWDELPLSRTLIRQAVNELLSAGRIQSESKSKGAIHYCATGD